jgi:hypothetical protein
MSIIWHSISVQKNCKATMRNAGETAKLLHSVQLHGIEGTPLHVVQLRITINVDTGEPISDRNFICFVLFAEHEEDKVFVAQIFLAIFTLSERPWCGVEYSVNNHVGQAMIAVLQQILPRDPIVTVVVQLPETTIEDIKMFIGKVTRDLVDVLLVVDLLEGIQQISSSDLT